MHSSRPSSPASAATRISADVGGTFTDVAVFEEATASLRLGKTLTTPARLVDGIQGGVDRAGSRFSQAALFLHGTTIAINTLLERTGARTALVTTRGFRDIYEIGRINRPDAYNLFFRKHRPLVERALRFEVDERLNAAGEVLRALPMEDLEAVARRIDEERVEAVAILFIHSYRNPLHEIVAKHFFERRFPHLFVTASHELSNEYREFERTSTVAANAYVGPRVNTYLGEVTDRLDREGFPGRFLVVQSSGGLYDSEQARRECVRMLESGPAAGVVATRALCETIGLSHAIAFDMGGTTAKAGVIRNGKPLMASSVIIGGYGDGLPIQTAMIDIREVGTGGGSIARLGPGKSLRVGPESAGAAPGPVCYGMGGNEPTVTDANLVLGRLAADRFLGGDLRLDEAAAREALQDRIAGPLGLTLERAAEGIIRIAAATMANIVKRITTERGLDTLDSAMVAFGGAGPLHAGLVAREMRIATVVIPNAPGHFSAVGMLLGDLRRDFVRTVFIRLAEASLDDIEALYRGMEGEGKVEVEQAAPPGAVIETVRSADMRYVGQEHAVTVELPRHLFERADRAAIKAHFDRVHAGHYGYADEGQPAEVVSLRSAVIAVLPKPGTTRLERGGPTPDAAAGRGSRSVYFAARGHCPTLTFDRAGLKAGNRIAGPALIEEYASTTVIMPDDALHVDDFGNLFMQVSR
jgi:N-methylhydantoinase A